MQAATTAPMRPWARSSPRRRSASIAKALWVGTDGQSDKTTGRSDGLYALETEGPLRGTSKLFFRCPVGAELCGPDLTPDRETFFVAVRHPGEGVKTEARSGAPQYSMMNATPFCRRHREEGRRGKSR